MKDAAAAKCARSWSIAWICSFINFLLLGASRLSGLLYLSSIDRYNVDRSRASLPFVLCYTVRNVSGPLIGYIGRKVEIRLVIASGCFLSAIGAGACFFAEDITTVTVLWGGVYGLGFGLGTILLPEILNQHFEKFISNANGIAFGGECVAGFVLPVIVELLLDTYGTSGTFLILSGLILHGIPAALLLKSPKPRSQPSRNKIIQTECINSENETHSTTTCICKEAYQPENNTREKCKVVNGQVDGFKEQLNNTEQFDYSKLPYVSDSLVDKNQSPKNYKSCKNVSCNKLIGDKECSIASETLQPATVRSHSDHCNSSYCYPTDGTNTILENPNWNTSCQKCISEKGCSIVSETLQPVNVPVIVNSSYCYHTHGTDTQIENSHCAIQSSNQTQTGKKNSSLYAFRVFLDPPFILILLTQSSMIFIFTTIMTVIVDFSRDAGVSSNQEVYVLMCLSVSDMLGRFGLGWVTDLKYMTNVAFSAVCYAGTGVLMVGLVFLRGFEMTMMVAFFIGLFLGGLLIVCPGIIMDYVEKDRVTMALASRFVLYAPMSLTQSSLIGYFRGNLGSYNGLFYILGINCFLCCVFSLLVPCAARLCSRKRNTTTADSEGDLQIKTNIS